MRASESRASSGGGAPTSRALVLLPLLVALVALAALLGGCTFFVSNQLKAGPGSAIPCTDGCGNDMQCEARCVDAPPATGFVH